MLNNYDYEPGQIWEAVTTDGKIKKNLIIAVQEGFANVLPVMDKCISGIRLSVGGSVNADRLMWSSFTLLSNPIDQIPYSELEYIKREIVKAIGLVRLNDSERDAEEPVSEAEMLRRERDIYKDMCYRLCGGGK